MSAEIRSITTSHAPKAAGHYSQGIVHNGLVYVAGQLPIDPATGEIVGSDIGTQAERALRNVEAILTEAGASLASLLSVTIYITERGQWGAVNEVFGSMLGAHRPARAVIPVLELKEGCYIEIQAIAAVLNP